MIFEDRKDAGKKLAKALQEFSEKEGVVVAGLVRGGVVVAAEIAKVLNLPLDLILVSKIGAPGNEELALGAIGEKGMGVFNDDLITLLGVSKDYLRKEIELKKEELRVRKEAFFRGRSAPQLDGKEVILVDDGIATGASMRAAIRSARAQGASKLILAAPVAAPDSLSDLEKEVDRVVCLSSPSLFQAVGTFYQDFSQVDDEEILDILCP